MAAGKGMDDARNNDDLDDDGEGDYRKVGDGDQVGRWGGRGGPGAARYMSLQPGKMGTYVCCMRTLMYLLYETVDS